MRSSSVDDGRGTRHDHEGGEKECRREPGWRAAFASNPGRLRFARRSDEQVLECIQGQFEAVVGAQFPEEARKIDLNRSLAQGQSVCDLDRKSTRLNSSHANI